MAPKKKASFAGDPEENEEFILLKKKEFCKSERARLNISGTKFEIRWSTLLKFPQTRLGRLASIVCDGSDGYVSFHADF